MPAVDGAVRLIDWVLVADGASAGKSAVPTSVSDVVTVASVER